MYQEYLYKQQLLNTMSKDNQLVDNVKLHLRQKIIHKLKSNKPPRQIQPEKSLVKKLSVSLFLDYLQQNRYLHTLSVFAPQSGFSKSSFSQQQLSSMFRIDLSSSDSILQAVLKQVLPKGRLTQKRVQCSVQTDDRQSIQNLQNKLGQIDFQYRQKMALGLKSVQDSEQRFLKWKNQVNKRYKDEMQKQVQRIRSFEISNVRMQERERYNIKIKEYQQELDDSYRIKMQKLRERQAEVLQRVTNKMKQVETYNYQMRQKILADLQNVKARQNQVQKAKSYIEAKERQINKQVK